jgi:hypothetical protein
MKFDVIVGNPPYQPATEKKGLRNILWPKFVKKSMGMLEDGGHLCIVHPSGWRGLGKDGQEVKQLLSERQMNYLEIHNEKDGLKIFGAETRYDWYILENKKSADKTIIKGQDGKLVEMDIANMPFIPNGMFEEVKKLIANNGEERVEIINNSAYHTQRPHMSKEKIGDFKYPCVYSISKEGIPTFWYSSTNERGHFGKSKVIFAGGRISSANYLVDKSGEYAMTQFASGIVDVPSNLDNIAAAMRTENFKRVMEMCAVGVLGISKDVMKTFRKDFWKQFVVNS